MDKEQVLRFIRATLIRLVELEATVNTLALDNNASDLRLAVADAITPLKLIAEDVGLAVEVSHG